MPKLLACDGGDFSVEPLSCSGSWVSVEHVDKLPAVAEILKPDDFLVAFSFGFSVIVASYAMVFPIKVAIKLIKKM